MGQDSAPYNRAESTELPYMRVLVRVEMSLMRQSFVACYTRCCKSPAGFLVNSAVRAEVAAQIVKELHVWQLMPVQGDWTRFGGL
jgi:hypothetical protein